MAYHFNFETGKAVNRLEAVKGFYINPYNTNSAQMLGLERKVRAFRAELNDIGGDSFKEEYYTFKNGMPIVVFPLRVLGLGTCIINWDKMDPNVGNIVVLKHTNASTIIYFRIVDNTILEINTVINH